MSVSMIAIRTKLETSLEKDEKNIFNFFLNLNLKTGLKFLRGFFVEYIPNFDK